MEVKNTGNMKFVKSDNYNYVFNKKTGMFMRWGKNMKDDPIMAPSPEIADIEISSGGGCKGGCSYCYKRNNEPSPLINMTLEQYKIILDKINPFNTLTQVALGIEDVSTNPEFWEIMAYTRSKEIMPNYTTNGFEVDEEIARKTASICGAVAVSWHKKDVAINAINHFIDAGMEQVNIHFVLAKETVEEAHRVIDIIAREKIKIRAIVFLGYKHKNPSSPLTYGVDIDDYRNIASHCKEVGIGFGFDSCSAGNYMKSVEGTEDEKMTVFAEPCESTRMSIYLNAKGEAYPCSFCEETKGWETGIDVINCKDFMNDVWYGIRFGEFRDKLIKSSKGCNCKYNTTCFSCPVYPETSWCKK